MSIGTIVLNNEENSDTPRVYLKGVFFREPYDGRLIGALLNSVEVNTVEEARSFLDELVDCGVVVNNSRCFVDLDKMIDYLREHS